MAAITVSFPDDFNLDTIRFIVEASGTPDIEIEGGQNKAKILHYCNRHPKFYEMAEFLLDLGADINGKTTLDDTPLINAAFYGSSKEYFNLLLDRGADVNSINKKGTTPIQSATKNYEKYKTFQLNNLKHEKYKTFQLNNLKHKKMYKCKKKVLKKKMAIHPSKVVKKILIHDESGSEEELHFKEVKEKGGVEIPGWKEITAPIVVPSPKEDGDVNLDEDEVLLSNNMKKYIASIPAPIVKPGPKEDGNVNITADKDAGLIPDQMLKYVASMKQKLKVCAENLVENELEDIEEEEYVEEEDVEVEQSYINNDDEEDVDNIENNLLEDEKYQTFKYMISELILRGAKLDIGLSNSECKSMDEYLENDNISVALKLIIDTATKKKETQELEKIYDCKLLEDNIDKFLDETEFTIQI